jgi:hypothetical protein
MEEAFTSRSLVESKFPPGLWLKQLLIRILSRFERELEALRKELAESAARSSSALHSRGPSQTDLPSMLTTSESVDTDIAIVGSPLEPNPHEISESKKDS